MLACPVSTDSAKSLPTGWQTTCTGDLRRANKQEPVSNNQQLSSQSRAVQVRHQVPEESHHTVHDCNLDSPADIPLWSTLRQRQQSSTGSWSPSSSGSSSSLEVSKVMLTAPVSTDSAKLLPSDPPVDASSQGSHGVHHLHQASGAAHTGPELDHYQLQPLHPENKTKEYRSENNGTSLMVPLHPAAMSYSSSATGPVMFSNKKDQENHHRDHKLSHSQGYHRIGQQPHCSPHPKAFSIVTGGLFHPHATSCTTSQSIRCKVKPHSPAKTAVPLTTSAAASSPASSLVPAGNKIVPQPISHAYCIQHQQNLAQHQEHVQPLQQPRDDHGDHPRKVGRHSPHLLFHVMQCDNYAQPNQQHQVLDHTHGQGLLSPSGRSQEVHCLQSPHHNQHLVAQPLGCEQVTEINATIPPSRAYLRIPTNIMSSTTMDIMVVKKPGKTHGPGHIHKGPGVWLHPQNNRVLLSIVELDSVIPAHTHTAILDHIRSRKCRDLSPGIEPSLPHAPPRFLITVTVAVNKKMTMCCPLKYHAVVRQNLHHPVQAPDHPHRQVVHHQHHGHLQAATKSGQCLKSVKTLARSLEVSVTGPLQHLSSLHSTHDVHQLVHGLHDQRGSLLYTWVKHCAVPHHHQEHQHFKYYLQVKVFTIRDTLDTAYLLSRSTFHLMRGCMMGLRETSAATLPNKTLFVINMMRCMKSRPHSPPKTDPKQSADKFDNQLPEKGRPIHTKRPTHENYATTVFSSNFGAMGKLDQGRLNLLKSQVWKVKVQEVVLHHQPQARVAPVQYQPQNQLLHNLHCECLPCARLVVHLLAVWELLQVPYTVDPPLHNLIIQPRQLGHQEAVQLHCLTLSVLPHQLGHAHVLVQSALQVKELLDNTFVVSDILDYHAVHQHSELLVHRHGHIPPIHLVHTAHANYEQVSTMCLCTKGSYSLACTHVFYIGQLPPKNYLAVASHHMQCDQALIHVRLHHSQHHDALPPQVPPPSGQHAQDIRVHHHGVAGATQQDTHGHGKHGQLGLDRVGAPFHQLRVEVAGTEVTHSPAVIGLHQPSPSQHEHDIHHQLHWAQDDQCVQPVQEGFHPIHIHLHVKHSQFLILQQALKSCIKVKVFTICDPDTAYLLTRSTYISTLAVSRFGTKSEVAPEELYSLQTPWLLSVQPAVLHTLNHATGPADLSRCPLTLLPQPPLPEAQEHLVHGNVPLSHLGHHKVHSHLHYPGRGQGQCLDSISQQRQKYHLESVAKISSDQLVFSRKVLNDGSQVTQSCLLHPLHQVHMLANLQIIDQQPVLALALHALPHHVAGNHHRTDAHAPEEGHRLQKVPGRPPVHGHAKGKFSSETKLGHKFIFHEDKVIPAMYMYDVSGKVITKKVTHTKPLTMDIGLAFSST